ncbi:MAG: homocysteine biosynthesis protein, partial [Candidatus Omnitrophica bacterium]|nr:homocysteine biosynthesis protein [Candidatus Omnitrophota bacterium]
KGVKKTAQEVDVVTTGTFSPMCSSGAYFNIGHSKPKIKAGGGTAFLNDIPAYTGFAAADLYIGAAALAGDDPKNKIHPGRFRYGGGHVIEDLVSGKDIRLNIVSYGTDCYPRQKLDTLINIKDINEAVLFNPRNCYQNYNVGINLSDEIIYTYMGALKPGLGNANYCSAGQLSPLLNDPFYKTIGIGTRIFLGGGVGYVAWQGTQHNPQVVRTKSGVPKTAAGTIAVIGDLKKMNSKYLKGASILGYGVSLTVGIGIPIPVLNEEVCRYAAVKDEDIYTRVVDYSKEKSKKLKVKLPEVNYAELKSGAIKIKDKEVPTASLSSYIKAKEIAGILKEWIKKGRFLLSEPVDMLPGPGEKQKPKSLKERPIK